MEDNSKESINIGYKLLESHIYWTKGRVLFNVIVGMAGLVSIALFGGFMLSLFDFFGIIAWGLVANAFYSFGYIIESAVIVRSKGEKSLAAYRRLFFGVGTIAYATFNILFAMSYFFVVPD